MIGFPKRQPWLRLKIFAFLVGLPVLLALAAAESYVRLKSPYGYTTPELLRSQSPQYSPALFARHVFPLTEQRIMNQRGELVYYINSLGYRGAPFSTHKQPGAIRIMVYGGSTVFDPANAGTGDWPHRLQERLRRCGVTSSEVINAGIPGHASFDCVGRLFAEGHEFHPDYVLFYCAWNDIKNFTATQPLLRYMADPYTDDPRTTYQNPLDRRLCEISQLYVRLRSRYYVWHFDLGDEGRVRQGVRTSTLSDAALRQYRLDVQTFVDVARNAGAVPVLVTEGRLVARNNTDAEKKRISYKYVLLTHEALNDAFEATDRILKEVSDEKNVALIDASAALSGRNAFFVDEAHLSRQGSISLADKVAASMLPILRSYAQ